LGTSEQKYGSADERREHALKASPPEAPVADAHRSTLLWSAGLTRWSVAAALTLALGTVAWYVKPETLILSSGVSSNGIVADLSQSPALRMDVVFAGSVGGEDRDSLISEIGARVVAGPSAAGAYLLEFPSQQDMTGSSESLLARMRTDPRVQFARRSSFDAALP